MPQDSPPTDYQLILRIQRGEEEAFGAIYDRYRRLIYSLTYRILRDTASSEEVLQDCFYWLWQNAYRFDSARGTLGGLLATVARNRALDRLRKRSSEITTAQILDDVFPSLLDLETELETRELKTRVILAMANMPGPQRQALELAYFEGLTHREIAWRTGAALGTVKGRIRAALRSMKNTLKSGKFENSQPDNPDPARQAPGKEMDVSSFEGPTSNKIPIVPMEAKMPTENGDEACEFLTSSTVSGEVASPAVVLARILIVDDSPISREDVRGLVENNPHWKVCGEATDGLEAIEKTRRLSPQLIIMDLSMPRMAGLEAASEILKEFPATLIILLTLYLTDQISEVARNAGIRGAVSKMHMHQLETGIHALLRGQEFIASGK